jgi:DNA ligase (NAD+)
MNAFEAKVKIEGLTATLKQATESYYLDNISKMTDQEFDVQLKNLEKLEQEYPHFAAPDSPTKRVGSDLTKDFPKVAHKIPMLSIDNSYTFLEVQNFMDGIKEFHPEALFTGELKMDGVSLTLCYENGILVRGATRGDGTIGDEVTAQARTISDIPLQLTEAITTEIRGECYLPHDKFKMYNAWATANGEEPKQNPRNAASGILKTKDIKEVARRGLRFRAFGIAACDKEVKSQAEFEYTLQVLGFHKDTINHSFGVQDASDFETIADKLSAARTKLPFDIDGIVIKVDDFALRETLGNTSKHVRWATAYKFAAEQAKTEVLSITLQVGRTGRVTPVAELAPVFVAGSTIKRSTLHNFDEIARLDLRVGDTVIIEKGGEVIPKITSVDLSLRPTNSVPFQIPTVCPACGSVLVKGKDVDLRCEDHSCPPQTQRLIEHFVSRNCMDVKHMGPSIVEALLDAGLVKEPLDMFSGLKLEDLSGIDRMGAKSAEKILDSIEGSRSNSADKLLCALGIRHLSRGSSVRLMEKFGSLEALFEASDLEISSVRDVGPAVTSSFLEWKSNHPNFIAQVKEYKMNTKYVAPLTKSDGALAGQVVVVTGTLTGMTRSEADLEVSKAGGTPADAVTKKTTLLVCGKEAGSKLAKAEKMGIKVVYEQEFFSIIGKNG